LINVCGTFAGIPCKIPSSVFFAAMRSDIIETLVLKYSAEATATSTALFFDIASANFFERLVCLVPSTVVELNSGKYGFMVECVVGGVRGGVVTGEGDGGVTTGGGVITGEGGGGVVVAGGSIVDPFFVGGTFS